MNLRRLLVGVLALFFVAALNLSAQSLTTGDITGTITDATGAVVPNAPVSARNIDTGAVVNTTTNGGGAYRFSLLKPGDYMVSVDMSGFAKVERKITVQVGQAEIANVTLSIKKSEQTIEVTGTEPIIGTNSSVNTSFTQTEMTELPNPGGDITNIALTAPGTVMNSTMGYGNFTTFGLPATSNLFTVNGENDMDPYFNINNTGATNLTLGSNEIQEVTVVSNPYGGEYGQLAGAQVSMITKSGTNQFHGDADYFWNGRAVNANDWMFDNAGAPQPFSNANQWGGDIGGPIRKDSTFFFFDTEGLRFILPNGFTNTIPTPAFANAVLANVAQLEPNESATFQQLFNLYASSPGASSAVPRTPSGTDACSALTFQSSVEWTSGTPCFADASSSAGILGKEWILATRVDQRIGKNDNIYFRYRGDHGLQPTYLDSINQNFNALSSQPAWDTQLNETHVFGPNASNAFLATFSHYVAQFQQDEAKALATFPYDTSFGGSISLSSFGLMRDFPQGRNISQYQFVDDFTLNHGRHTFKFGENFRRYDVSDHNFFYNNPLVRGTNLQQFANGLFTYYRKADNFSSDVPVAMWGMGLYAQDEWNVRSNLKLTFGLRAEHNSNPVCQTNCFANFVSPVLSLPSFAAGGGAGNVPYNQDIKVGLHQAYQGVDTINWAPRFGFSWSPRSNQTLVLSGGFGIFYDNPPAGLVDNLLANPPIAVRITVQPTGGTPAYDTTSSGSAAVWSASANAFSSGFSSGQTYSQIKATLAANGVPFAPPNFTSISGTVHSPLWEEWNLQVQKEFANSSAFIVNYVGNHGQRLMYSDPWYNTWDPYGLYSGLLPDAAPVPNYGTVSQWQSGAISNYDGLVFSYKQRYKNWLIAQVNYTYSHNLDEASNGGVFTYGDSILGQINPAGLRIGNYGNSDYDIRHLVTANYVINPEFHPSSMLMKQLVNGWQLGGKVWIRTGLPFSVTDGNWSGALPNGGETIMAQPIGGVFEQTSCGRPNATGTGDPTVPGCLNPAAFVDSGSASFAGYTAFSNQERNQFRGPGYVSFDMALYKNFNIGERFKLGIGATAFNVFNHPNFYLPNSAFVTGDTTFGQISGMTPTPTSPYGAFFGFDSSPRIVQLSAKLKF